jgi:dihydropteroate synthase
MAVLNASPESFSGGVVDGASVFASAPGAVDDGASVLDIGGQSLRTDQPEISIAEEIARVVPLIEVIRADDLRCDGAPVSISIDTYRAEVAAAALAAGADLINDVSGSADPEMAPLVAERGAGIVIGFNPTRPKTGPKMVELDDPVGSARAFFDARLQQLDAAGVSPASIVLDPGPDLGKSPWATVQILRSLDSFRSYGCRLLLALSRKDFLGAVVEAGPLDRDAALFGVLARLRLEPSDLLRCHDPRSISDFYRLGAVVDGTLDVERDLQLDEALRRI